MARRYVIIGAGAIGGGIGGLLAHANIPAVLVARGAHLAAMRADGLTLRTPEGTQSVAVQAIGGPDEVALTADDVLVLSTKTHQAEEALRTWADAPVHDGTAQLGTGQIGRGQIGTAGELLPVLTALNGVASEPMALRWFARVFGVCVWMPAVYLHPGEVLVRSTPKRGLLHTGRSPAALADDADRHLLDEIVADWARADLVVPTPSNVMAWKYRKLVGNLGNAFQALLGDPKPVADLVQAARDEALALLDAAGIALSDDTDEARLRAQVNVQPVPGEPEHLGGSTWQSLARGTGSAESDYLNGEIVALAHRLGRTAPVNATIARLMRTAVATGARPGDLDEAGLRTALASGG